MKPAFTHLRVIAQWQRVDIVVEADQGSRHLRPFNAILIGTAGNVFDDRAVKYSRDIVYVDQTISAALVDQSPRRVAINRGRTLLNLDLPQQNMHQSSRTGAAGALDPVKSVCRR